MAPSGSDEDSKGSSKNKRKRARTSTKRKPYSKKRKLAEKSSNSGSIPKLKGISNNCFQNNSPKCHVYLSDYDLTQLCVDAIVCPSDDVMSHDSGLAAAIADKAGKRFRRYCLGRIGVENVVVTRGYESLAQHILWVLGQSRDNQASFNVDDAVLQSIKEAEKLGCASVAVPSLMLGKMFSIITAPSLFKTSGFFSYISISIGRVYYTTSSSSIGRVYYTTSCTCNSIGSV